MKAFTVREDVFKTEPLFVLGCDRDRFCAYIHKRFPRVTEIEMLPEGVIGQMLTFDSPPWRVVWASKIDLGTIAHETFHLVTRICQDKGIPIVAHHQDGAIGDESAAYLLEFFIARVGRRLGLNGVRRGH